MQQPRSTNVTETAAFSVSSSDVSDAVTKINAISATTGVQASATDDYKVLLSDKKGGTIEIQNTSTRTDIKVESIANDGTSAHSTAITMATADANSSSATVTGTIRLTQLPNSLLTSSAASGDEWFSDANTPAALSTVGTVDITSRIKASDAIAIIDGAIQKSLA